MHAVCAVGFRSCAPPGVEAGASKNQEVDVPRLYIHDDNIGPAVRFDINEYLDSNNQTAGVYLTPSEPPQTSHHPTPAAITNYGSFVPMAVISATHEDIRLTPDYHLFHARRIADALSAVIKVICERKGVDAFGVTYSIIYKRNSDYLNEELDRVLDANKRLLSKIRLALAEQVRPMALHIGIIRLGTSRGDPLADILLDTTETSGIFLPYATICFSRQFFHLLDLLSKEGFMDFGALIGDDN